MQSQLYAVLHAGFAAKFPAAWFSGCLINLYKCSLCIHAAALCNECLDCKAQVIDNFNMYQ